MGDMQICPLNINSPTPTAVTENPCNEYSNEKFTQATVPSAIDKKTSGSCCSDFIASVKTYLPIYDHPAAQQPTPYNINRYVLLALYLVYTLTTASVYFNWMSITYLLLRNNAFQSLCLKDANGDFINDMRKKGEDYVCNDQESAVQILLPITTASNFIFSAVAGFSLDSLGMKVTSLLGQSLLLIGWLSVGFGYVADAFYYVGFLSVGAGCDMVCLPVLPLANLFPDSSGLIITIIGAGASFSFYVPLVLKYIAELNPSIELLHLCVGYICLAIVPCMILAFFVIPYRTYKGIDTFVHNPATRNLQKFASEDKGTKEELPDDALKSSSSDRTLLQRRRSSNHASKYIVPSGDESIAITSSTSRVYTAENTFRDFLHQLLTIRFLLICLYFLIVSWSINYYTQASSNRLFVDKKIVNVLEILVPLSCIPCIILGKLVDVWNCVIVIAIVNASGVLMYALVCIQNAAAQYLSVLSYVVYISLFTSQIVCYIEVTFPSAHFGKLVGFCFMFGGLMGLLTIPLYHNLTIDYLNGNTTPLCISFSVLLFLAFVIILFMWRLYDNVNTEESMSYLVHSTIDRDASIVMIDREKLKTCSPYGNELKDGSNSNGNCGDCLESVPGDDGSGSPLKSAAQSLDTNCDTLTPDVSIR